MLSIWGLGLKEDRHVPHDPAAAKELIEWFRSKAPAEYRVTYMGGTPSRWRTLTNDAREGTGLDRGLPHDGRRAAVDRGPLSRCRERGRWKDDMIVPDLALAAKNQPALYAGGLPGLLLVQPEARYAEERRSREIAASSSGGRHTTPKWPAPRVLKIAMFDEVNEGTAIFKIAARRQDAPDQGYWLTLDADGADLPSDWYLRLAGEITRMFHGEITPSPNCREARVHRGNRTAAAERRTRVARH